MASLVNVWSPLALVLGLATVRQSMCNEVVWFDSKRIETLAKDIGFPYRNASVWRDGTGTKLYLGAYTQTNDETVVAVLSRAGSEVRRVRGGGPIFGDDGKLVCSITNHTLVFSRGETIRFTPYSRFGFSPGGALFFYFRDVTNGAAVFRSSDPGRPLFELPQGFMPQTVFFQTGLVFLFGQRFKPGSPKISATGLVYSLEDQRATLKKEIGLSRFAGVTDMDASSGLLLVEGEGELARTWGLLNPDTGRYTRRGWSQGSGLFLDEELARSLERRWQRPALGHPEPVKP